MDNDKGSEEGEVMTGNIEEKREQEEGVSEKQITAADAIIWGELVVCDPTISKSCGLEKESEATGLEKKGSQFAWKQGWVLIAGDILDLVANPEFLK